MHELEDWMSIESGKEEKKTTTEISTPPTPTLLPPKTSQSLWFLGREIIFSGEKIHGKYLRNKQKATLRICLHLFDPKDSKDILLVALTNLTDGDTHISFIELPMLTLIDFEEMAREVISASLIGEGSNLYDRNVVFLAKSEKFSQLWGTQVNLSLRKATQEEKYAISYLFQFLRGHPNSGCETLSKIEGLIFDGRYYIIAKDAVGEWLPGRILANRKREKIEKIEMHYVEFLGYPSSANEWVSEQHIFRTSDPKLFLQKWTHTTRVDGQLALFKFCST